MHTCISCTILSVNKVLIWVYSGAMWVRFLGLDVVVPWYSQLIPTTWGVLVLTGLFRYSNSSDRCLWFSLNT